MWKTSIALFIAVLILASGANAQYARQELLAFESATMSVSDFLTGKKGTPVTLAGDLRLPKANGNCPGYAAGSPCSELREQPVRIGGQGVDDVPSLLPGG